MKIIIDTNILEKRWTMRSGSAAAFLDFVKRSNSVVYVPKIVWEELKDHYRKDIILKHESYETASKQFGSVLVDNPELKIITLNADEEVNKYFGWLQSSNGFVVVPYGADFTERIATRVMKKLKPFNLTNDHEYKDTLIWETVLDIVSGKINRPHKTVDVALTYDIKQTVVIEDVVFISNDGDAFGRDRETNPLTKVKERPVGLHPTLEDEVNKIIPKMSRAYSFFYHSSLDDFLSKHSEPVSGFTMESVKEYLTEPKSLFFQAFYQKLSESYYGRRTRFLTNLEGDKYGIHFDVGPLNIDEDPIQEFYTYPFTGAGKLIASGIVSVSGEVIGHYQPNQDSGFLQCKVSLNVKARFDLTYSEGVPSSAFVEIISSKGVSDMPKKEEVMTILLNTLQ